MVYHVSVSHRRLFEILSSTALCIPYLLARLAVPDTGRVALDAHFAAECAGVSGVLGDFNLLDLLAEGGTVAVCTTLVPGSKEISVVSRWT